MEFLSHIFGALGSTIQLLGIALLGCIVEFNFCCFATLFLSEMRESQSDVIRNTDLLWTVSLSAAFSSCLVTLVLYNKTEIQGRYLAMIFGNVCPAALFLVSIDGASSGERAIGVSYAVSPLPAISFPLIAATLSLWATRWFLKMGNPDMSTTDESQRTGPENEN